MNFRPAGRPPKYPAEGGRQQPHTVLLTPALAARVLEHGPTVSAGVNVLLRQILDIRSKS